jgi:hypothetical protein
MRGLNLWFVVRTVSWPPLGVATGVSAVIVAWPRDDPSATPLQAAAILLTSAAGFALDDPAASILAASPTSMLRRRLRCLLAVWLPTWVLWGALVQLQGTVGPEETKTLIAMFIGLATLSAAIAGVVCRRRSRGGRVVAPTLLVLLFLSTVFPPPWRPLPMGDIPGGLSQIALRWSAAAVVGMLVFLWSSRDPAAMPLRHRVSRALLPSS